MNFNKLGWVRGEGQAPHPFFVVELPNSPLPASGRVRNNDRLMFVTQ